ncbi:unnamed protein product [Phytophthora fragariaefolia]|uniref:Unnamed protein product n=1 Tax=Phytophthora fragariaefolia TaxID=1490495 RepID=A0A9W6XXV4_9STRA|nr:unnamed protein product [Phytophthora fragariaefolia]
MLREQRWVMAAALVLAAATAMIEYNVSDSDSASDSDSWSEASDEGHKGCFEVAMWCDSLQTAVSPDPANDCKFPCPDINHADSSKTRQ